MKHRFYLLPFVLVILTAPSLKAQHPDNPLTESAAVKEKSKNSKEAIADCNKATKADPYDIQLLFNRSLIDKLIHPPFPK